MNNLDILKDEFKNDEKFISSFYGIAKQDVDTLTPSDIVKLIHHDCTICLCYGCRKFTHNYNNSQYKFTNLECEAYIKDYFSRDFNPDTDNCQCPSCKKRRGEDNNKRWWILQYNSKEHRVEAENLPEAKAFAIEQGFFEIKDYPYIKGIIC